jgi:SAM-dependent methyltransferase
MTTEQEKVLREKAKEQIDTFLADCKIQDFRGKRILEVGFKNGIFLDECSKIGMSCAGLEVLKPFCDEVKEKFPHLDIFFYDGGTFPAPDSSFDFVVSFQVLEHVRSIEHTLGECVRVLKPGGFMYHVIPNYFSFYEGHYAILWCPFFNKSAGRAYLKLLGRYDWQIDEVNIVKPHTIRRDLNLYNDRLKILSLGREEFIKKFDRHQIDKVNQKFLRGILKIILSVPVLKKIVLYLVTRANLYYPITVIARRL